MPTTKQAPKKPDTAPPSRIAALGYAAPSATSPFAPFRFERRQPGPSDVQIEIQYCGVCHSDLHTARGEWGGTVYPVVPGVSGVALSSPQFEAITVRVGQQDGSYRLLHIAAPGAGSGDGASFYVKSLKLNGTSWPAAWLPLEHIAKGGKLTYAMTADASAATWGADASAMPSFPRAAGAQ